jgi:nicotinamidase-related amidase
VRAESGGASAAHGARALGRTPLREGSAAFLDYLDSLLGRFPAVSLADIVEQAGGPANVALIAVDVVNGFCTEGPLASPRVGRIVEPIARLMRAAHAAGVRSMAVLRDSHAPDAPEFTQFGPHCVAGTPESALVDDLARLPFAAGFHDVPKNATSAWFGTGALASWVTALEAGGTTTFVVVGDCTDLCVYQTAMPLVLRANATNRRLRVVVPVQGVDTYDLPVAAAARLGAPPHDGDLLHAVFLYHLHLNGVEVVSRIEA